MDQEKLYASFLEALAETLGIEVESIKPEQKLSADLEFESIDFLDLNFRLERKLKTNFELTDRLQKVADRNGAGTDLDLSVQELYTEVVQGLTEANYQLA